MTSRKFHITVDCKSVCLDLIFSSVIFETDFSVNLRNRSLIMFRRRWEYKVRMQIKDIGINTRNWVDSAQDRDYWRALVTAALNLRINVFDNFWR